MLKEQVKMNKSGAVYLLFIQKVIVDRGKVKRL